MKAVKERGICIRLAPTLETLSRHFKCLSNQNPIA